MIDDISELDNKFYTDLLNKRILYIFHEINSETAAKVGQSITWLNAQDPNSEIILYLDSRGGEASSGFDICDKIESSKAPVTGIVYRRAYSMAAIILQTCNVRKAYRHSEIQFHSLRVTKNLLSLQSNLQGAIKDSVKLQNSVYQMIRKRTGLSQKEVKELLRKEKFLTAPEAKEKNLIDQIIASKDKIF